ncbi:MAG: hypothetical protein H7293_20025 [Candidatus Saccharibacteria bacterium]|nr:hypothetical protein [Rhodoferax sp.]
MPPPNDKHNDHSIRIALLEKGVEGIEKQLNDMNGHLQKLVWAIIVALVMAAVQFILRGGLK